MSPESGARWAVREQVVEDPAGGLTFQFEVAPDGRARLRVFGESLPFGNREILFDHRGLEAAAGSFAGLCRPARLGDL